MSLSVPGLDPEQAFDHVQLDVRRVAVADERRVGQDHVARQADDERAALLDRRARRRRRRTSGLTRRPAPWSAPSSAPACSPCPGRPRTGSPRRRPLLRFESVSCASLSSYTSRADGAPPSRPARGRDSIPADPGMILRCRSSSNPPPALRHRSAGRRPGPRQAARLRRPASLRRSEPRSATTDVGTFSAQWQATRWPPPMSRNSGSIGRAVLRVAELLAQPAPGVEAAAGRRRRRRGDVALQHEALLADPRIGVGDRRQERHACTGGAGGGRAPRPRRARRACRGTSPRPGR